MKIAVFLLFLVAMLITPLEGKNRKRRSFDIDAADYASFSQNLFFNTIGKAIPYGSILSNVITLFKSASGKPSLFDQIREKVQREVIKGISDYHNDNLLARIRTHNASLFTLYNHTLQFEPEKYLDEMIRERKAIFVEKHFFYPTTFENSIGYDPEIISCIAPLTMIYMSLSYEIENYYYQNNLEQNGAFKINLQERKDFLSDVTRAAEATMKWALDKRESLITHEKSSISGYNSYDESTNYHQVSNTIRVWTKQRELFEVELGHYAILAHKVRKVAKNVVEEVVFDPLNKYLEKESLIPLKKFVDKKINFPKTVSGGPCRTPCMKQSSNYWWCGIEKVGYSADWNYCSPTNDTFQRTITGEVCQNNCKDFSCKTQSSSEEKCSSESTDEDINNLTWPIHHGFTIYGSNCFSDCQKYDYYWFCYTSSGSSWDYCSPPSDPQSTYLGKTCKSECEFSTGFLSKSYYYCYTDDSWDYCSRIFHTESTPSPCSSDDCVTIDFNPGEKLAENDDWYYAYKFRQYLLKGKKYFSAADAHNMYTLMVGLSNLHSPINPF